MKAHIHSGGRYPVLRSLGILMIIAAALALIVGVARGVWGLFTVTDTFGGRLIWLAFWSVGAFISAVMLLAFAESIKLFIDIEHNTRMAVPGTTVTTVAAPGDGSAATGAHVNRISALDEETAEGALLRGH
jgi:hypothetical protein